MARLREAPAQGANAGGQGIDARLARHRQTDHGEPLVAHELDQIGAASDPRLVPHVPARAPEELGDHVQAERMLLAGHRHQQHAPTVSCGSASARKAALSWCSTCCRRPRPTVTSEKSQASLSHSSPRRRAVGRQQIEVEGFHRRPARLHPGDEVRGDLEVAGQNQAGKLDDVDRSRRRLAVAKRASGLA